MFLAFTRGELIDQALGYQFEGLERTLDSHIKNLRKKIASSPEYQELIAAGDVGHEVEKEDEEIPF